MGRRAGEVLLVIGLVLVAGCDAPTRPERQGQIVALAVDGSLDADGVLALRLSVTFAGDRGGVVPVRAPVLGTASGLTLDGSPRTDTADSSTVELRALRRSADVTASIDGVAERYADILIVTFPVWGSPSDGAADDPPVPVTGTLHLPAPPLHASVHWHGAVTPSTTVEGNDLRLDGSVSMGKDAEVVLALPADALAAVAPVSSEVRRPYFDDRQAALDRADGRLLRERDDAATREDLEAELYWGAVGAEIGVPLLVALVSLVRTETRRRRAVQGVPASLADPPGRDGPAVVALVAADGRDIGAGAVAGTILWLAHRKLVSLEAAGEGRYRLGVAAASGERSGAEGVLLDALRPAMAAGAIVGPPLPLAGDGPWWKAFRREVLRDAKGAGLLRRRYRSALFCTSTVLLAMTTAPLWFRTPEAAAAGTAVAGILLMLPFVGGYVLTSKGHRAKAQWEAFGRYTREHGDLGDVDPGGIVIWGPYLAYGAALGLAGTATRALTPGGSAPQPVETPT